MSFHFSQIWRWAAVAVLAASCCAPARAGLFDKGSGGQKDDPQDIAARSLLNKADAALKDGNYKDAEVQLKAIRDQFPTSEVRFDSYFMLGDYYMKARRFDDAVAEYTRVLREADQISMPLTDPRRVKGCFKTGEAFYEAGKYPNCITQMRKVVADFPGSEFVNYAYYYIGMCHYKQKNWIKVIESLQLVGTDIPEGSVTAKRLEAKKRFYIKVSDADLAVLKGRDEPLAVTVATKRGDSEKISLRPLNMKGDVFLGSIATDLGEPFKDDGTLDVCGLDEISVEYVDKNTSDGAFDIKSVQKIGVVGNGSVALVNGAYDDELKNVVLGQKTFLRVIDYDCDTTAGLDKVEVRVRSLEPVARNANDEEAAGSDEEKAKVEYRTRDEAVIELGEKKLDVIEYNQSTKDAMAREYLKDVKDWKDEKKKAEALAKVEEQIKKAQAKAEKNALHAGVFVGEVQVNALASGASPVMGDKVISACPGDMVEVEYRDANNVDGEEKVLSMRGVVLEPKEGQEVPAIIGNIIKEADEQAQQKIHLAEVSLNLGQIFQDLGLNDRANTRFEEGIGYLNDVAVLKGCSQRYKEQMYDLRMRICVAKGDLEGAARVCDVIMRENPGSAMAENALLQLGNINLANKKYLEAIKFFSRLANVQGSAYRAEAQFNVGTAYEEIAKEEFKKSGGKSAPTGAQALIAYQACMDRFPGTPYAGKAAVKIAAYYLANDPQRADEFVNKVLKDFGEEPFVPEVLLAYGRTLYQQKKKDEAIAKWRMILDSYPGAPEAAKAKSFIDQASKGSSGS